MRRFHIFALNLIFRFSFHRTLHVQVHSPIIIKDKFGQHRIIIYQGKHYFRIYLHHNFDHFNVKLP